MYISINILPHLLKFLYIFFRIMGFFTVAPIFGRRETPLQARIGFSALLTVVIFPLVESPEFDFNTMEFLYFVVKEVFTGIIVGFTVFMIFSLFFITGQIIDLQMGFGIVNVIDPQSNTQIPLIGNLYYIMATLIFLTINGHHTLISSLIESYKIVPLGAGNLLSQNLLKIITDIFENMILIGIKLSLPIIGMIFIVDFILAIIAKIAPQINVFIVGLPLKIFVGIFALIIVLPSLIIALDVIFNGMYEGIYNVLKGMLSIQ
ncbi:MAG: flagellar biosynthetic protein FliR [Thermovenabulum sp.]|uniref:flagellar biosynthetic protein FliR n=1 Tax=Thermovenabulum sp. TaxID=3100335 RepID=UPI003C79EEC8